jgi:hypothetical protein
MPPQGAALSLQALGALGVRPCEAAVSHRERRPRKSQHETSALVPFDAEREGLLNPEEDDYDDDGDWSL